MVRAILEPGQPQAGNSGPSVLAVMLQSVRNRAIVAIGLTSTERSVVDILARPGLRQRGPSAGTCSRLRCDWKCRLDRAATCAGGGVAVFLTHQTTHPGPVFCPSAGKRAVPVNGARQAHAQEAWLGVRWARLRVGGECAA